MPPCVTRTSPSLVFGESVIASHDARPSITRSNERASFLDISMLLCLLPDQFEMGHSGGQGVPPCVTRAPPSLVFGESVIASHDARPSTTRSNERASFLDISISLVCYLVNLRWGHSGGHGVPPCVTRAPPSLVFGESVIASHDARPSTTRSNERASFLDISYLLEWFAKIRFAWLEIV